MDLIWRFSDDSDKVSLNQEIQQSMNQRIFYRIFQIILATTLLANFGLAQKKAKTLSVEGYYKRRPAKIKNAESATTVRLAVKIYQAAAEDFSKAIEIETEKSDLYFHRASANKKLGKTLEPNSDKLQEEKLLKINNEKLPEFRKQIFEGLSKSFIEETSLIDEP